MNTKTMSMSKEAAKEKADAYRKALARRSDDEYAAALTVYEAMEEGLTVIDVGAAIREGGFDEKMRPKLAIARADRRQVEFEWRGSNDIATFNTASPNANGHQSRGLIERVNFNRRHGQRDGKWDTDVRGFALVPLIPADVRPEGQQRNWHIIWEVEQWADQRIGARAAPDPYLLRRLSGDLFVILAEWNLTEVELLVTQGRALLRR
jgi:hypothetical protein